MAALTLREEIANAIRDGFGREITRLEEDGDDTLVHVEDYDEPIRVEPLDVDVPDCFPAAVASGILLDIKAILVANDRA